MCDPVREEGVSGQKPLHPFRTLQTPIWTAASSPASGQAHQLMRAARNRGCRGSMVGERIDSSPSKRRRTRRMPSTCSRAAWARITSVLALGWLRTQVILKRRVSWIQMTRTKPTQKMPTTKGRAAWRRAQKMNAGRWSSSVRSSESQAVAKGKANLDAARSP